jgi:hypothetical protein
MSSLRSILAALSPAPVPPRWKPASTPNTLLVPTLPAALIAVEVLGVLVGEPKKTAQARATALILDALLADAVRSGLLRPSSELFSAMPAERHEVLRGKLSPGLALCWGRTLEQAKHFAGALVYAVGDDGPLLVGAVTSPGRHHPPSSWTELLATSPSFDEARRVRGNAALKPPAQTLISVSGRLNTGLDAFPPGGLR